MKVKFLSSSIQSYKNHQIDIHDFVQGQTKVWAHGAQAQSNQYHYFWIVVLFQRRIAIMNITQKLLFGDSGECALFPKSA